MKILPDGYKVIENDDLYTDAILAMKANIDLLYARIVELETQKTEGQNEGRAD